MHAGFCWSIIVYNTEMEHHHLQHGDGASSFVAWIWNIIICNMELEHHHLQHGVGTSSSSSV